MVTAIRIKQRLLRPRFPPAYDAENRMISSTGTASVSYGYRSLVDQGREPVIESKFRYGSMNPSTRTLYA